MKKSGIILLCVIMLIMSCTDDTESWSATPGDPPRLTSLIIKKKTVTLGTPDADPLKAVAGSATLKSSETGTDGQPTLIVKNPVNSFLINPRSSEVKWGVTSAQTPPDAYSAVMPDLENGKFLWIQVTAEKVSAYYVIAITVEFGLEDFDIKYHPTSRQFTLTNWSAAESAAQTLTVEMAEESPGYQYQWYSSNAFSTNNGQVIADETDADYTPTITANGNYYYYVTVTFATETLTSNVAMIKIDDNVTSAPTEFTIGDTRLNYVRGVGGTGSFMFRTGDRADASPDADVRYIELLFGEIGCNILRIMVQDDYKNYITNAVQSRNSAQFFHNASENFFPVIRKVNEYGGYVFANPWTAPVSMKVTTQGGNQAATNPAGGYLRATGPNYVDYAEHLRGFLKWLNENDAPIFALGILNEPDYGGGADYEGMGMTGNVTRDWFRTVGHFTTQRVTNRRSAGPETSIYEQDIIPGYGGGGPTHHVLTMSGDVMGDPTGYMSPQIQSKGERGANNRIELVGRHYYNGPNRYRDVAGNVGTPWKDRPQIDYTGAYEAESLALSRQMYAPGSTAGNIKREVWQTEHDFNYASASVNPPAGDPQRYWNSAFAAVNDVDWALRIAGESVFDWWFSSSYSGLVTSWHTDTGGWQPYTITPRGRAFAHYARYVNETWFLPIERTKGTINFNQTGVAEGQTAFNAGATDPKISAFEDVNGKFISVVMFTPSWSTAGANGGAITSSFGAGGTNGNNDPTRGSTDVGKIAVVLPEGFVASGASAIRSYGHDNATGAAYDAGVPTGSPRYWIDEPVFLSPDGKSVEVTLPGGNLISIMIKGEWTSAYLASNPRHFEERARPYTVK